MVHWLLIAVMAAGGVFLASTLAVWIWGRFARRAGGAPTYALPRPPAGGILDRRIAPLTAAHPGQTALALLASNTDAFAARALLAQSAARSLDLMYYIWEDDLTGRLLLAQLLAAADRGVRVRLLLDDVGVNARDAVLLALNAHPGIEIRLFNPTRARRGGLRRGIEMALRLFSITRRMHNKAWVADGRAAIIGGRNIGDAYFDAAEVSNFRDLDLLVLGPVVDQVESMFDGFWNSGLALPVRALAYEKDETPSLRRLRQRLHGLNRQGDARPYLAHVRARTALLRADASRLIWCATARLVADPPQKTLGKQGENWLMREVEPLLAAARREIAITSPYFIPGAAGTAQLAALSARGVQITVLTNSLAATDVAAVHGGYARYRRELLRAGIRLFELRPALRRRWLSFRGATNASLHTKAFTVDGATGFIGSLNFDPRSASLNTEMGVIFGAPALIAKMEAIFREETGPDFSYALALDPDGRLSWQGEAGRRDPATRWPRRAFAALVGLLPLESQL